jgi:hypothetical protein
MSDFNVTTLAAPDQNLRKIYLKARLGQQLTDSELDRVAQRQGIEATNLAQGGINLTAPTDARGKPVAGGYEYLGKPSPSEVAAKETAKSVNSQIREAQSAEAKSQQQRAEKITGKKPAATTPAATTPAATNVSPELPPLDTMPETPSVVSSTPTPAGSYFASLGTEARIANTMRSRYGRAFANLPDKQAIV